MVMVNQRLASGDVGIGLNVRRMRERLLRLTLDSLMPIALHGFGRTALLKLRPCLFLPFGFSLARTILLES